MADDPVNDPYGKPPKDIFKDFLEAASKTVESNHAASAEQAALKGEKDALRAALHEKCAEGKDVLREKYEGHLHPILAAMESLPEKDGKKFHVKVAFSDGCVDEAADALDETAYLGPSLTITVRYDKDWGKEVSRSDEIHPMIKIVIAPDKYMPNEDITVTRFDKVYESWDQGGMTAKTHDDTPAYGYDAVREKLGEWLGDNAPDRLEDLAAAKHGPAPKGPTLPPPVRKYNGGSLKP